MFLDLTIGARLDSTAQTHLGHCFRH